MNLTNGGLGRTEFSDLSYDNFEALEFFIEEANEKLKGMQY